MAATPTRGRNQKYPSLENGEAPRYFCCRCGEGFARQRTFFPASHSPMYRGSGFLPICNHCVDEMYEYYRTRLGEMAAVRRMCMKLDIYWDEALFDAATRSQKAGSLMRNYIAKTNVMRYIDKNFDDTLQEEGMGSKRKAYRVDVPDNEMGNTEIPEETEEMMGDVPEDIRLFWGSGYTPAMYHELEERKRYWLGKYPSDYKMDIGEEALIKQICGLEVDISHDRADGRPVKDSVRTLNELLGSAKLKPIQKKDDADAEVDAMPLGVGIQKWEDWRPLPETPPDQRDVSKTIKNITTWFLGHACKMVGLRNGYVQAYEDELAKYRVAKPEYEDEDDEAVLNDIFAQSVGDSDGE